MERSRTFGGTLCTKKHVPKAGERIGAFVSTPKILPKLAMKFSVVSWTWPFVDEHLLVLLR